MGMTKAEMDDFVVKNQRVTGRRWVMVHIHVPSTPSHDEHAPE
jgi:hypothetical protein